MNAAWISAILLGGAALITAGITAWTTVRERRVRDRKQQGEVTLTVEQTKQVAAQAASINNADRIATERWWQEQFNTVRDELVIEQQWRRRMTSYIRRHQPWDEQAQQMLKDCGMPIPPPPKLDVQEFHDDDSADDASA